jgi:iron-sulfur cluster assembly protein
LLFTYSKPLPVLPQGKRNKGLLKFDLSFGILLNSHYIFEGQLALREYMENPIQITDQARLEITTTLEANKIPDTYGLRVGLRGGGCSGTFLLGFDTETDFDQTYKIDGIKVIIDKRHLMYVLGVLVDYEEGMNGSGYTVSSPDKK